MHFVSLRASGRSNLLLVSGPSWPIYGPHCSALMYVTSNAPYEFPQVKQLYTAPTALRSLMKLGDHFVESSSRKSLRVWDKVWGFMV